MAESNRSPNNRAFSLLELLISVAILSIGIVAIMQAFSFSARSTGLSCDVMDVVFLAKDKLQELEAKEFQGSVAKEPSPVKDRKDKFAWGYTLTPDTDLNLYRLDLDIRWQRGNREESMAFNTYLR